MMKKTVYILVMILISGTFPLIAGDNNESQRLVGIWKIDSFTQNGKKGDTKGASIWIEFLPDGTGRAISQNPGGERETKQIFWTIKDNLLSITEDGKTNPESPAVVSFAGKGSKLILNIKNDNIVMYATRVSKSDPDPSAGPEGKSVSPRLVGTWKVESFTQHGKKGNMRGDKMWMEFFPDGTGRAMRQGAKGDREMKNISWIANGNILSMTEEGKTEPEKPFTVIFQKGDRQLSLAMEGNDVVMYMARIPGSIPGLPKKPKGTRPVVDDTALAGRITGIWRVEVSESEQTGNTTWYELRPDGACRMIEGSGGTARVAKKGTWIIKGNMLLLRDEGRTDGDEASVALTDGDTKLELKPKSSDSALRLVRETGELPPISESDGEKSQ